MPVKNFGDRTRVESGTIIMWAGPLADIPTGWVLCDGNNSTPDLTGRFIKGTPSTGSSTGSTGGQESYTLSETQLPSHSHNGTTDPDGQHNHTVWMDDEDDRQDIDTNAGPGNSDTRSSGSGGAHKHTFYTPIVGEHPTLDNLPAYYELAFIQKT